jgi:hypothetical protein
MNRGLIVQLLIFAITCYIAYIYNRQLCEMRKALTLETKAARAEKGPNLVTVYLGVQQKGGKIWAEHTVQNLGQTLARNVAIAARLDFRTSAPTKSDCTFDPSDFKDTSPTRAQASGNGGTPVKADDVIWKHDPNQLPDPSLTTYIWGQIRYADFTDTEGNIPFCRLVSAKKVLSAASTPKGYAATWDYCECK